MTSPGGLLAPLLLASLLLFLSPSTSFLASAAHSSPSARLSRDHELRLTSSREGRWKRSTAELDAFGTWGKTYRPRARSLVAMNTTEAAMEQSALLAIKNSMQTHDSLASWSGGGGNSSYCSGNWKGVSCDETGHVLGIELANLGLNGTISPVIGDLSHLAYLNLSQNNLAGNLPLELNRCKSMIVVDLSFNFFDGELSPGLLYTLPKLEFIRLSANNFTGPLPAVPVDGCKSLTNLRVAITRISGAIPSSLSRCEKLEEIILHSNQLSGVIPKSLGGLHQLQFLYLNSNTNLTGEIPSELASLKKLEVLDLHNNKLVGSIPTWLGGLSLLRILWLENNAFSGQIPSELVSLEKLEVLALDVNKLAGSIPTWLGGLSSLMELWLGGNAFSGQIPSELVSLKKLEVLALYDNKLAGSIPTWLGGLSSIKELWLGGNAFSGQIPSELASLKKLEVLSLINNKLEGSIPTWLGGLSSLKELRLVTNAFSGPIPSELGSLKELEALSLYDNKFVGSIPTSLGGLSSLKELWLEKNAFSGHIPSELGNLKNLEWIELQVNNLSGQIPSSLARCSRLRHLILNDNNLTGVLPDQLHNLSLWENLSIFSIANNNLYGTFPLSFIGSNSKIRVLNYSKNNFTGTLPTKVNGSDLSNLHIFMVSYNRLKGPIPSWIGDLKSLQVLDLSNNVLIGTIPDNFGNLDAYKVQSNINSSSQESTRLDLQFVLSLAIRGRGNTGYDYSFILSQTTYMDVSSNALEGEIPLGITNLIGMKYLFLSNNNLNGEISSTFQYMEELESLDLSQNKLTGTIPTKLPFSLNTFNVSYNNLNGAIPLGDQFNTFGISSYLPGNPSLCGEVIKKPCIVDNMQLATNDTSNDELKIFDYASLVPFGIGLVCGYSILAAILLTWPPTFKYVFEGEIKRRAEYKRNIAAQFDPQQYYGLFKYPT